MSPWKRRTCIALAVVSTLGIAACAWARRPPDPHTVARTLSHGGRERSYRLHVPPGIDRRAPVPLVLVLHGGGGNAIGTERMTGFSVISDREGFVAVYPEGVDRNWNDGRDASVSPAHRDGIDDLGFIAALIDAVGRELAINPDRIYATGISNGAIFSHYIAANLSPRIAAIAPVVGGIAEPFFADFHPERPVSVLVVQGTEDPLVPYGGGGILKGKRGRIVSTGAALHAWIERDGCRAEPKAETLPDRDPGDGCVVKRSTWSGGAEGTEVSLLRIEGGGHTWPSGPQYLPEAIIGRVCRDIDGSELIWEFFRTHARRGA